MLLVALHPIPQLSAADHADNTGNDLLVVDCLLPGQIRKLGRRTTYVSARRAIKTTARDCRIRGGEYVAYDRASYQSSLKIWLPLAQEGDAEAALYVGEIYERGVGGAPDYTTAAAWYEKAAAAGDVRAQVNLGHLYEGGLGVPQDPARAREWYRLASGVGDIELNSNRLTRDVLADNAGRAEADALRAQFQQVQTESEQLRKELVATRSLLEESRLAVRETAKREAQAARQAELARQQAEQAAAGEQAAGASELAMREVLQLREDEIAALRAMLATARAELDAAWADIERQEADLAARGEALERAAVRRDELSTLAAELEKRDAELLAQQAEAERLRLQFDQSVEQAEVEALRDQFQGVQSDSESLRQELANTREELEQSRAALQEAVDREQAMSLEAEAARQQAAADQQAAGAGQLAMREALRQREEEIVTLQAALSATRTDLDSALADLGRQEARLAARGEALERAAARRDELSRLAGQLERREAELIAQQAEAARLRGQIDQLEAEANDKAKRLAELEASAAARQQLLVGPEIALVEPQLQASRGIELVASMQVAMVAPDVQTRNVIGRATAPAGLLNVSVNDRAVETNPMGVFKATVELSQERTPVAIVAVDQQGKRAALQFDLLRSAGESMADAEQGASAPRAPDMDFGDYYALVIGNNEYRSLPNLQTAVADARDIDTVLREKYGFRTTLLINASRYQILSALNDLRERLTAEDNLLVFYAGHGELDEVNMRGHWLPVDAEMNSTANWLSNVAITDILNVIAAKQVLVIADSCYSGSLTRSSIGRLRTGMTDAERLNWLSTMLDKRARMVFTSGGLAPVLDAGGGEHSVFTKALLDALVKNQELIEGQRLHQEVAARVAYAAAGVRFEQVPQYAPLRFAGHETGDFFFVPQR